MSTLVKYRIREVAKDLDLPVKTVMDLVTEYFEKPKNNMQVLTEEQLNFVFDRITHMNQISSLEQVFAVAAKSAAPKAETAPAAKPEGDKAPAASQQQKAAAPQQPAKPKEPERKRERRVVDTSAVTVNASRFDDHADSLVSERVQNYKGGMQRIGNNKAGRNSKQKRPAYNGSKSRNEEQEKMRRLQLEVIKKTPLTVKIPDEISVGELASRMKKTGAEVVKQLIKLGVMASVSQVIDFDTASLVAMELGCKVEKEVIVTIEEKLIDDHED
ncbi:MAG: translation initiation factor IF-2, partial [Ruminococcaceae bacterium]|nr:translation initiation factor IF-2 [Oscillospiraceae bacterium]